MRAKDAGKTASRADDARDGGPLGPSERRRRSERPAPFVIGDVSVAAGTRREVSLPIARLPAGAWSHMPVLVLHGRRPGPTIWAGAAIHGDELNGIEIVRRLAHTIETRRLAGTVLAVPIVNVLAVVNASRYLPDRRDLNRAFPGSPTGSLAARLAHLFFETVAERCAYGIDIHTGSGGRFNSPQVRCDLDDAETRTLASAFGAPLLFHAALRDGSLREAARKRGTRVLLYEAGEAERFDDRAIELGLAGCLRVMRKLGMIDDAPSPPVAPPLVARSSKWMRAGHSGFCHVEIEPGDRVVSGQVVAIVTHGTSRRGWAVRSRVDGVVIGVQRAAMVHRGDALVHVAEIEG